MGQEDQGITVERLRKSYGKKEVLRDVSFHAPPASVTCFMAPSGGGKTTLLRILLGLETADGGTVRCPEPCRWAAVFQEDRLLEHLDAAGNLRFVLGRKADGQKTAALLEELGLREAETHTLAHAAETRTPGRRTKTRGKPVREYSGGMKRRLSLARALLSPADALALDEPFTGLDRETRRRCLDAIRRYGAGKMIFLATHDPSDADALEGSVVTL